jgi:hypothetical protein
MVIVLLFLIKKLRKILHSLYAKNGNLVVDRLVSRLYDLSRID